ncbi:BlaI/MecI/CopY family transcriptional regulator [Streptomyces sp. cg36]|uniref:BlaI/MecI/CopY family transcriptional regulator n=1 Tax=Streptomyces sp. cg36 TaxID=3238798 RepID=UPI0034E23818
MDGPGHGADRAESDARRPAGELEAGVLAALWAADGPLTPGEVQSALGGSLARTTVTTILTRLYEKGALTRGRSGRGFAYTPTEDSPGLTARRMHTELAKDEDRSTVLARFVSQLSDEDERLLRALLDGGDHGQGDTHGHSAAPAEAISGERDRSGRTRPGRTLPGGDRG